MNANFQRELEIIGNLTEEQLRQILVGKYKGLYNKYLFAEARGLILQHLARHQESFCLGSSSNEVNCAASPSNRINSLSRGMAEMTVDPSTITVSESQRASVSESNATASNSLLTDENGTQGPIEYSVNLETITSAAKHPEYASIDARTESFTAWPSSDVQNPKSLAEAGFYFTGRDDRVRCFACDGGLCNWAPEDVPWYEHSKWYGNCPYVIDCQRHPVVAAIIDTCRTIDRELWRSGNQCASNPRRSGGPGALVIPHFLKCTNSAP